MQVRRTILLLIATATLLATSESSQMHARMSAANGQTLTLEANGSDSFRSSQILIDGARLRCLDSDSHSGASINNWHEACVTNPCTLRFIVEGSAGQTYEVSASVDGMLGEEANLSLEWR